jgi:hypothetical protein
VTELAKTVHSLGKGNLPDLLAMTLPSDLMKGILLQMSDPEFRGLDDSVLMRLFASDHTDVRTIAALKCGRALAKARMKALLATYVGDWERDRERPRWEGSHSV